MYANYYIIPITYYLLHNTRRYKLDNNNILKIQITNMKIKFDDLVIIGR